MPKKTLDNNTQIGRLYGAMKRGGWLNTSEVAQGCAGTDDAGRYHGPSFAPSTKISELRTALIQHGGHEEIVRDRRLVNGRPVHFYRLQPVATRRAKA